MRFSQRLSLAVFAGVMGVLGVLAFASSAFALEPWWHLSSSTSPTYLKSNIASEVEEVTVSATEGSFYLENPETRVSDLVPSLPYNAKPAEMQSVLEELYGAGNVEVTKGEGDEKGDNPYVIKFKGALSDQPVKPVIAASFNNEEFCKYLAICPLKGGTLGRAINTRQLSIGSSGGTEVMVTAVNLGNADVNPERDPVVITDTLPAGLRAVGAEAYAGGWGYAADFAYVKGSEGKCTIVTASVVTCVYTSADMFAGLEPHGELPPYETIEMHIAVALEGAKTGEFNEASVTGGEAPNASVKRPIVVRDEPVPFGLASYEMRPEEEGGIADTQAGSHPFQLTTEFSFNENATEPFYEHEGSETVRHFPFRVPQITKDLHFNLPPGLVGNPTPFPQCPIGAFLKEPVNPQESSCPAQTVVGVARVDIHTEGLTGSNSGWVAEPLISLEPAYGEPARFGFLLPGTPVYLNTAVHAGGDYGVTVSVINISELAELGASEVTFWGVPGDARHDSSRNSQCLLASEGEHETASNTSPLVVCPSFEESHPPPLISLPTSCNGSLQTSMETDSWQNAGVYTTLAATEPLPALDGCNRLPYQPEIRVKADVPEASKPSGLTVDVHVPQQVDLAPEGLSASDVKTINVALPEELHLNPSAADGLAACSDEEIGFEGFKELDPATEPGVKTPVFSPGEPSCPNASKIANVTIHSPLLPEPLTGSVYLAAPQNFKAGLPENPFELLVGQYLVAKDPKAGILVKFPLNVKLTESGQILAMQSPPQLPFEDAELEFLGGERAPLATPSRCGTYTTVSSFAPWSGNDPVTSTGTFQITTGPNGNPCPGATLPFNPSLSSGTTNINAASFSELTTTLSRPNGNQSIRSVTLHYPPGVSGLLEGVKLCGEAEADAGTCGKESEIGETIVSVGVGGEPFTVTGGKVYITGPYNGKGSCTPGSEPGCASFGLSITNPAKAGPFDLQEGRPVVVRAKVEVNPVTAALTVTTNTPSEGYAIPSIIEGFSLQIQHVNVLVNRQNFTFNPTNCDPMAITGTINGGEGATSPVSVPLQIANCATLKFEPKFAVATSGKTSRANGASLSVKLSYPSGSLGKDANVAKVKVDLPKQLPSRLTTLQKACTAAQFEVNPAGCPAASIVGHATAITPLVPVPLSGPAYFVSYGDAKFPELVIALQGYGVTIDLHGETFISKAGITSSTFRTVPDAPVGSFELTLPQGGDSALAANGNLCKSKLVMPTLFVAQNGMTIKRSTPISVTGCPKKATKAKKAKRPKAKRKR
jgi:hypothetical protein